MVRMRRNQNFERIDEEEDDEMTMQKSITDSPDQKKEKAS